MQMQNRLVTVIGGSGFVGRYLVKHLAEHGARIRVAVRRPDEALFLKPLGDVGQVVPVQANLRVPPSIAAAVAGADMVVNLVGVLYQRGPQTFHALHTRGAEVAAREARLAGARRFIQISAIGADLEAPSQYGRSKAAGEAAVRHEFPQATIIRPSLVFGPEDDFFNRFGALARVSPVLPLIGGGQSRFQPVYVGDVARAIVAALLDPATAGQTYELGGPRAYSFTELMQLVLAETGRRCLLVPLPVPLAMAQAMLMELLPVPLLTRDQVRQLQQDNVPAPGRLGLAELGIKPTPVEAVLPKYMYRYRRGGARTAPRFG